MIRITTTSAVAFVEFAFDAEAVEIIRSIPGRCWDGNRRRWIIDSDHIRLAATRFDDAGFDVTIDGQPFTPSATSAPTFSSAPLGALFHVLPDHLRQPVYEALSRVLHPDVGGDTALMQQLNQAPTAPDRFSAVDDCGEARYSPARSSEPAR